MLNFYSILYLLGDTRSPASLIPPTDGAIFAEELRTGDCLYIYEEVIFLSIFVGQNAKFFIFSQITGSFPGKISIRIRQEKEYGCEERNLRPADKKWKTFG